jgi:RNA polymerase primary sigma factor
MKQKYEGKDLQGLVDLGREQGYLTFEQVSDFLPQDVASLTDLRAALESFEDMDIKILEVPPVTLPLLGATSVPCGCPSC